MNTDAKAVSSRKPALLPVLVIYTIVFFAVWTVFESLLKPWINSAIPEIPAQLVNSGVIKNLVWTLPALLLAHRYESEMYVPLREMFTAKVNLLRWLPVFAILVLWGVGADLINTGTVAVSGDFGMGDVIIVLFVGITEESVFRGWLLNATLERWGRWPALMVNAMLFLAIHFPKWIVSGEFLYAFTSFGFAEVIALSLLFGWSFVRTRNLVLPIALHMVYDLAVMMFI